MKAEPRPVEDRRADQPFLQTESASNQTTKRPHEARRCHLSCFNQRKTGFFELSKLGPNCTDKIFGSNNGRRTQIKAIALQPYFALPVTLVAADQATATNRVTWRPR